VSDTRDLLEGVGDRFDFPADALGRLEHRRARRQRSRRVRAGALGIAIAIAVAWLGISAFRSTSTVPADHPTETPSLQADDPTAGSVATPYRFVFVGGTVTLEAADPPWTLLPLFDNTIEAGPGTSNRGYIRFLADPRPVGTGCEADPAAVDAESMAAIIGSDPDIRASAPVPVHIAGTDGLQMEVAAAPGASLCDQLGEPGLFKVGPSGSWGAYVGLNSRWRYRLYLLDAPGPIRIMVIQVWAPDARFDALMEAAGPVLDSIQLHAR